MPTTVPYRVPAPFRDASRRALIIKLLDEISRARALSQQESLELEWAIRADQACNDRRWRADQDHAAQRLRSQGKRYVEIAPVVHRTPDAVAARLRYLNLKAAAHPEGE